MICGLVVSTLFDFMHFWLSKMDLYLSLKTVCPPKKKRRILCGMLLKRESWLFFYGGKGGRGIYIKYKGFIDNGAFYALWQWNAKSRASRAINLTPPSPFGIHSKQNASMVAKKGEVARGAVATEGVEYPENCRGTGKYQKGTRRVSVPAKWSKNCRGEQSKLMRSFECQQEKCAANKNNIIFIINLQLLFSPRLDIPSFSFPLIFAKTYKET